MGYVIIYYLFKKYANVVLRFTVINFVFKNKLTTLF